MPQDSAPPREGSLSAPIRHPLAWQEEAFYDLDALDVELRRQFDVCHGCRRCFNLCDSFPRLFDMIDEAETGELDSVASEQFPAVEEACTLCDMCFMTKCPYVPPHEFNIDFPHLMLRYRAARRKQAGDKTPFVARQLTQTDRNGKLAAPVAGLVNVGSARGNWLTRPVLSAVAGIDRQAELPKFVRQTYMGWAKKQKNKTTQNTKRKAVIYATCVVNYNAPNTGKAALRVLSALGVDVANDYSQCCGMPLLEQGDIGAVAQRAKEIAKSLRLHIDEGRDVITLTASCGLMFKFEWPLIVPDDENVRLLAEATKDICQYVVEIANAEGLGALQADNAHKAKKIAVHQACHARAQNMGPKAVDLLRLIPESEVALMERCSGHGGTFGVLKSTAPLARKVGKPLMRNIAKQEADVVVSDCPLAAKHIKQSVAELDKKQQLPALHPIEHFATAYGLMDMD